MECQTTNARRRALTLSVAALLAEVGFDSVEKPPLETLVEMFQSSKYTRRKADLPFGPRWCSHQTTHRSLRRTWFSSHRGCSWIFTHWYHAGRCRWSVGFLAIAPFPLPVHSSAAPFSPHFILMCCRDLDIKSRPNLSTPLHVLTEMGNSTRAFCELACRTEPVVGDVMMALINMGVSLDGLEAFAYRSNRIPLPSPALSTQPKQPSILQAGVKQSHPQHIPNHLPPFPDPHAYIRTPTHKQPVTEYEAIREKAASQKRDVERALTRFMAKTGDTHSLFLTEDNNMFPCEYA
ncbi:hypothetical protein PR048_003661 [Dryococelus australis]|uniref:Transcription initiation factor TFIID subunit 8 n=1 Tax=Dryococelus australis TaxID=614101 RepID=A0ABQ9INS0_9NEOP|nr:hypothetical protein PR048_003661 [Dryococelus australis]